MFFQVCFQFLRRCSSSFSSCVSSSFRSCPGGVAFWVGAVRGHTLDPPLASSTRQLVSSESFGPLYAWPAAVIIRTVFSTLQFLLGVRWRRHHYHSVVLFCELHFSFFNFPGSFLFRLTGSFWFSNFRSSWYIFRAPSWVYFEADGVTLIFIQWCSIFWMFFVSFISSRFSCLLTPVFEFFIFQFSWSSPFRLSGASNFQELVVLLFECLLRFLCPVRLLLQVYSIGYVPDSPRILALGLHLQYSLAASFFLLGECYRPRHLHSVLRAGHSNFLLWILGIFRGVVHHFTSLSCVSFSIFTLFSFQIFWFRPCWSSFRPCWSSSRPCWSSFRTSHSPGFRFVMLLVFNWFVVDVSKSLHIWNNVSRASSAHIDLICNLCTYCSYNYWHCWRINSLSLVRGYSGGKELKKCMN